MPNKLNYKRGDKIGRWTVIKSLGSVSDKGTLKSAVIVKCECGTIRQHFSCVLNAGFSKSCGCFRKENAAELIKKREHKHNLSKHPLFSVWRGMRQRCYNKESRDYPRYGGRGIFVCKKWRDEFLPFYNWAIVNGWQKGLINDRRNNEKGYSPGNCRFVTDPISMRNTRRTVNIEFNGVTKCITDWANHLSITLTSLKKRIRNWGIEKALTTRKAA